MSLGELSARLQGRLQALTGGRRAATPGHHWTLRATIDWGHDLCTTQEQLMWRLCVFAGDFDAEAAEQACGGGALPSDDVLEQLIGLVDKSVVLRTDTEPTRYRFLDTLREYGAERLAGSGEEETYRIRHIAPFRGDGRPRRKTMEILQAEQRTAAATARAALGDTAYEDLHARGASLDGAAAVAYAVEDRDGLPEAEPATAATESVVPRRARTGSGELTHREREVAALVAERLTNREITERLVVSQRIVDAHVEHILTKPGLTSRTQITGLE